MMSNLYNDKIITYVGILKNGAGPINMNPPAINTQPMMVTYFGFIEGWSHNQPQHGAEAAYTPPFITNIKPSIMGENLN